ncbi:hypothetical protein VMCG_09145 [Cytospora schulzeri]|uniref:Uncharacterized protein n=1 Tax=Cytospora schulzeri TaxID=448051 RepID=A0A423VMW6_9PEZI|nr:hypothetical protein VMCG_09145 [Valsa malicola]
MAVSAIGRRETGEDRPPRTKTAVSFRASNNILSVTAAAAAAGDGNGESACGVPSHDGTTAISTPEEAAQIESL